MRGLRGGQQGCVQLGATVHQLNASLGPRNRKLGPDPASEEACTIGRLAANNTSGMDRGTVHRGFHVLNCLPNGH
ncbi:FAD-binding protein [Corynebacterium macginleyi]